MQQFWGCWWQFIILNEWKQTMPYFVHFSCIGTWQQFICLTDHNLTVIRKVNSNNVGYLCFEIFRMYCAWIVESMFSFFFFFFLQGFYFISLVTFVSVYNYSHCSFMFVCLKHFHIYFTVRYSDNWNGYKFVCLFFCPFGKNIGNFTLSFHKLKKMFELSILH